MSEKVSEVKTTDNNKQSSEKKVSKIHDLLKYWSTRETGETELKKGDILQIWSPTNFVLRMTDNGGGLALQSGVLMGTDFVVEQDKGNGYLFGYLGNGVAEGFRGIIHRFSLETPIEQGKQIVHDTSLLEPGKVTAESLLYSSPDAQEPLSETVPLGTILPLIKENFNESAERVAIALPEDPPEDPPKEKPEEKKKLWRQFVDKMNCCTGSYLEEESSKQEEKPIKKVWIPVANIEPINRANQKDTNGKNYYTNNDIGKLSKSKVVRVNQPIVPLYRDATGEEILHNLYFPMELPLLEMNKKQVKKQEMSEGKERVPVVEPNGTIGWLPLDKELEAKNPSIEIQDKNEPRVIDVEKGVRALEQLQEMNVSFNFGFGDPENGYDNTSLQQTVYKMMDLYSARNSNDMRKKYVEPCLDEGIVFERITPNEEGKLQLQRGDFLSGGTGQKSGKPSMVRYAWVTQVDDRFHIMMSENEGIGKYCLADCKDDHEDHNPSPRQHMASNHEHFLAVRLLKDAVQTNNIEHVLEKVFNANVSFTQKEKISIMKKLIRSLKASCSSDK